MVSAIVITCELLIRPEPITRQVWETLGHMVSDCIGSLALPKRRDRLSHTRDVVLFSLASASKTEPFKAGNILGHAMAQHVLVRDSGSDRDSIAFLG